ncbi:MAG: hypothetical protein U0822_22190 [Anaerolineae bacterium]
MARQTGFRHWVALAIVLTAFLAGCQADTGAGQAHGSVNVVQAAGLDQTTQLEIIQTTPVGQAGAARVLTDTASIQPFIAALNQELPLRPRSRCLGQYRLRFHLSNGQVQEFEYFCQGGASFLRGDQAFWVGQEVGPPPEFDRLVQRWSGTPT